MTGALLEMAHMHGFHAGMAVAKLEEGNQIGARVWAESAREILAAINELKQKEHGACQTKT